MPIAGSQRTNADPAPPTGTLSVHDLLGLLHTPLLLKAWSLALRPARLILAATLLALLALIIQFPALLRALGWLSRTTTPEASVILRENLQQSRDLFAAGSPGEGLLALARTPVALFANHPWATLLMVVPLALGWGILGGAICRSAAVQSGQGRREDWIVSLAFGLARWGQLFVLTLLPWVCLALLLAVGVGLGWALFGTPGIMGAGGVLFFTLIVLAFLCVLIAAANIFASPITMPALACEGTDSVDAVQRGWAYVFARPVRLLLSLLLLGAQLVLMLAVLSWLVEATLHVAAWLTTRFADASHAEELRRAILDPTRDGIGGGSVRTGLAGVSFWSRVLRLLVPAYALSYFFSAGTILYLSMRRACDGQDPAEIWEPRAQSAMAPVTGDQEAALEEDTQEQ